MTLFFAYLLSITLTGAGQAWIAKKWGDDSLEQAGLLSLNPVNHFNLFEFVILFTFFRIGIGYTLPLNDDNINMPYQELKTVLAYCSRTIINIVIAITSLFFIILLFGPRAMMLSQQIFQTQSVPFDSFTQVFAQYSSLSIITGLFLTALIFENVVGATLNLVIQMQYYGIRKIGLDSQTGQQSFFIALIAPLIILFFFGDTILLFFLRLVSLVAIGIAYLIGST
jgi:hypothetical protein